MKKITKIIHCIVVKTKAEEFFVHLRQRSNLVRKFIPVSFRHLFASFGRFIPPSTDYPKDDYYSVTRDNTHFRINRSDYVQWRLFYGVRDNALLEAKRFLTNNSIVLDIGANFGAFSLRLARHALENNYANIHVHAFEPNPFILLNYNDNLALNSEMMPIIHLHGVGLGNETGERSFYFEGRNTGVGRVMRSEGAGQFNVTLQRLDDFISELNPARIAFIKLIAGGFEPEILKGGWNTIKKYKPPIFFEVTKTWWGEHNYTIEEVIGALAGLGYRFRIEHYNEMRPYEPSKYASRFQFNLLGTVG